MTGGGTGGHVFPALAVARVLRERGHEILFIGTREAIESRLVPEAGHNIEFIRSGGLNRVSLRQQAQTALMLPGSIAAAAAILRRFRPDAVFGMGGYVAGPVMAAAVLNRFPLVIMEPNAVPGFATRRVANRVYRALLGFESTRRFFRESRAEVTGVPVRREFFEVRRKNGGPFTLLVTGGSRGARSLNRASRESWPLFRDSNSPVRFLHQSGAPEHEQLADAFRETGMLGEVVPFIEDMPAAFSEADLVVARAGAGAVNEIAAAGMPSILVPLPFAADDHQRKNAEALVERRAAEMVRDAELTGTRLYREVEALRSEPALLERMRERVRQFAKPGAAERAAEVLEEAANSGKK